MASKTYHYPYVTGEKKGQTVAVTIDLTPNQGLSDDIRRAALWFVIFLFLVGGAVAAYNWNYLVAWAMRALGL